MNTEKLSEQEVEQIKKFVALLVGEESREGISFALVSQSLDIAPEKLNELYDSSFKSKLVQEIDEQ